MTRGEVRRARERLELTQRQLAARVGVAENTVWRWEAGERTVGGSAAILIRLLAEQAPTKRRRKRR